MSACSYRTQHAGLKSTGCNLRNGICKQWGGSSQLNKYCKVQHVAGSSQPNRAQHAEWFFAGWQGGASGLELTRRNKRSGSTPSRSTSARCNNKNASVIKQQHLAALLFTMFIKKEVIQREAHEKSETSRRTYTHTCNRTIQQRVAYGMGSTMTLTWKLNVSWTSWTRRENPNNNENIQSNNKRSDILRPIRITGPVNSATFSNNVFIMAKCFHNVGLLT